MNDGSKVKENYFVLLIEKSECLNVSKWCFSLDFLRLSSKQCGTTWLVPLMLCPINTLEMASEGDFLLSKSTVDLELFFVFEAMSINGRQWQFQTFRSNRLIRKLFPFYRSENIVESIELNVRQTNIELYQNLGKGKLIMPTVMVFYRLHYS